MRVCNSPDIFQENISELFEGLNMVRAYIDDILVITKNNFKDHLNALDKVQLRLDGAGLKVNTETSFFGKTETEHLRFWLINRGMIPLWSKVYAIKAKDVPTKVRKICRFLGIVNYYRDMWCKRAHKIAPLKKYV